MTTVTRTTVSAANSDIKTDVSGLLGSQEKYEQWRQLRLQIEELTDHWLSLATASLTIVQSRSVVFIT